MVGAWSSSKEGLSGFRSDVGDLAKKFDMERTVSDPAELIGSIDLALVLDDFDGGERCIPNSPDRSSRHGYLPTLTSRWRLQVEESLHYSISATGMGRR